MVLKKTLPVLVGVGAVALVAAPAFAGLPYTVSVDGDTSGTPHEVTALSKGAVTASLASGLVISCTSVLLGGEVNTGTVQNPTPPIAEFSSSTWTGCTYRPLVRGGGHHA